MIRITKTFVLTGALLAAAACGDGDDDDHMHDAARPDAATDAMTDTSPPPDGSGNSVQEATVAVQDLRGVAFGPNGSDISHGLSISINYGLAGPMTSAVCTTTEYDLDGGEELTVSEDFGPTLIEIDTPPFTVTCSFDEGVNVYLCPTRSDKDATELTVSDNPQDGNTDLITGPADTFEANDAPHSISFVGTELNAMGRTRVTVPIVGVSGTTTLIVPSLGDFSAGALEIDMGTFDILAGEGPNPQLPAPVPDEVDFVGENSKVSVSADNGAGFSYNIDRVNAITEFTEDDLTVTSDGDTVNLETLWDGQVAGSETDIVFDCSAGCGSGFVAVFAVTITSTSATPNPTSPTDVPRAGNYVTTTCGATIRNGGTEKVTLPAEQVAKHIGAGIQRSRVTVSRFGTDIGAATSTTQPVRILAGHGLVAFPNRTP